MWNQFRVLLFLIFISIPCHSSTQDQNLVTYAFATYNTHFLSACMAKQRQSNFQLVVDELSSVNVVALQEVRDRIAVEYHFKPEHWTIVIDDDSTDDMNLAFAIRKGTQFRLESGNLTNADHVLDFAFSKDNENFTDERRVLKLYVSTELGEILVLNHHAKSRYNGRSITDRQRVNASLDPVAFIEGSSEQNVILLGDLNDTPDDASSNTLEMGFESSRMIENEPDQFLINLAKSLVAHEAVSYGLKSTATTGEFFKKIDPVVPGSRWANIDNFDTDQANTHGLYDQIFISRKLEEAFAKQ
jgi:endonuclease/exonuclease/phosphatase family metal-dependent hydrolase